MRASVLLLFAAASLVLDRDLAATRRGGKGHRRPRWMFLRGAASRRRAANQLQWSYQSISIRNALAGAYGYCD